MVWYEQAPALLVLAGAGLLAVAVANARGLGRALVYGTVASRALLALIVFFIAGYLSYAWLLRSRPPASTDYVAAAIMLAGGLFVLIVTRLGVAAVWDMRRIASLEHHRAMHDALTELPNRTLFIERLEAALGRGEDVRLAILVMDMDGFREINDTLGHHHGDLLLKRIVPRLRTAVGDRHLLARTGGDEFAILLFGAGEHEAVEISRRIAQAMRQPVQVNGYSLSMRLSIGIAWSPEHGDRAQSLLQHADVAMYLAKRSDADYACYAPERDQYSLDRLQLIGELRQALERGDLVLHYQPKVHVATRSVCGAEALVRWRHPQRGLLPPDVFVPIAEQTGLIRDLTSWVIDAALCQCAQWRGRGLRLPVSVNLSARNLRDADLPALVRGLLQRWDVSPDMLTLEITESAVMADPARSREIVGRLDELGVRLSIDDFGTGYSSLSHLKQLPASEIKIDKSFVMDMLEDEIDAVIVRSTIDLAHNMGRHVVAEGVVDAEIYDLLEILGCDIVQGYHAGEPLPAAELEAWMTAAPWVLPA